MARGEPSEPRSARPARARRATARFTSHEGHADQVVVDEACPRSQHAREGRPRHTVGRSFYHIKRATGVWHGVSRVAPMGLRERYTRPPGINLRVVHRLYRAWFMVYARSVSSRVHVFMLADCGLDAQARVARSWQQALARPCGRRGSSLRPSAHPSRYALLSLPSVKPENVQRGRLGSATRPAGHTSTHLWCSLGGRRWPPRLDAVRTHIALSGRFSSLTRASGNGPQVQLLT